MSNVGQGGYNSGQYGQAGGLRYRTKNDGRYGIPQQIPPGSHNGYMPAQNHMGHPQQMSRAQMQGPQLGAPVGTRQQQMMQQQQQQQQQHMMQHHVLHQHHHHQQQQSHQQPPGGGIMNRDGISLDMNEFPSLGAPVPSRGNATYSSVATVRNNGYGNDSQRPAPEFDLNEASFPALPSSGVSTAASTKGPKPGRNNNSAGRNSNTGSNGNNGTSGYRSLSVQHQSSPPLQQQQVQQQQQLAMPPQQQQQQDPLQQQQQQQELQQHQREQQSEPQQQQQQQQEQSGQDQQQDPQQQRQQHHHHRHQQQQLQQHQPHPHQQTHSHSHVHQAHQNRPTRQPHPSQHQQGTGDVELLESNSKSSSQVRQYGLHGLLDLIRMNDPSLQTLTLGIDLSAIGLDVNSKTYLHTKFASPWSESPTEGTPAFVLPLCYQMGGQIASRTQHFPKFHVQSLFYIFYTNPLDVRQGLAAMQLYKKNWRYHKQWNLWLTPNPNTEADFAYLYFDKENWEQRPFEGPLQGLVEGFLREQDLNDVMMKARSPPSASSSQTMTS